MLSVVKGYQFREECLEKISSAKEYINITRQPLVQIFIAKMECLAVLLVWKLAEISDDGFNGIFGRMKFSWQELHTRVRSYTRKHTHTHRHAHLCAHTLTYRHIYKHFFLIIHTYVSVSVCV